MQTTEYFINGGVGGFRAALVQGGLAGELLRRQGPCVPRGDTKPKSPLYLFRWEVDLGFTENSEFVCVHLLQPGSHT